MYVYSAVILITVGCKGTARIRVCVCAKRVFFCGIQNFYLPAAGLFSRSRLRGTQGAPACTPRCKCGSWPGSVARARGVKSREIWQVVAGLLSDELKQTRPMQTPKTSMFFIFHISAAVSEVPHQQSKARQPRYNSRASSFPLCDSHELCFCVWVRELSCVCMCHCRTQQQ